MKIVKAFFLLVLFTLIIGCAPPQTGVSLINEATQTMTATPSVEALPTSTPDNAPTQSKTNFAIQSYCPEVAHAAHALPNLTGTLVLSGNQIMLGGNLYSPEPDQESIIVFWTPESGEKITYQLPEQSQYYYYVTSPNQEKLAFTEGKTLAMSSDVIVLSHSGEESGKLTLPDNWNLFDWLNDEVLLIRQARLQTDELELIAVNPVNGEEQILPAHFPNLYSRETFVDWGTLTIFDPAISFVLYPKLEDSYLTSILWDLQDNKEITSIVGGKWPRWAPNGRQLMIVTDHKSTPVDLDHDEVILVKSTGDVTRITFFKEHFEHSIINLPVWSPDGRYVAFWLSTSVPIKVGSIAVLDTETSNLDLYCNEFNPFPFRFGGDITLGYSYFQVNAAPPIWSPDSQYLLVENYQQFTSSTYLIDLKNHTLTKIADDVRPVGWMK